MQIEQIDRDAAADAVGGVRPLLAEDIRAGRMDGYAGVQAFARFRHDLLAAHRHASPDDSAVELERLRAFAISIRDAYPGWNSDRIEVLRKRARAALGDSGG